MVAFLSKKFNTVYFALMVTAGSVLAQAPVLTFTPAQGATNVNENVTITIVSNVRLDLAGGDDPTDALITARIRLKVTNASGADIPFSADIDEGVERNIVITPDDPLPSNTVIFVEIRDIENRSNDVDISPNPQSVTFTTGDNIAPTIAFSPLNSATNVSLTNDLTITFNEAVRQTGDAAIDATALNTLVELKETNNSGTPVAFTATIDGTNKIITINPTADLASGTLYYLEINPVEDFANNATSATSITFTTVDVLPPVITFTPLNAATGVNETDNITISFDEPIRRASDDVDLDDNNIDARITLKLTDASGANIPFDATINAGNDVVTINPAAALPSSAVIYVAIAGVEDASNNIINPDPAFITFTTDDTQPPAIIFNPLAGATNVSLTGDLTITFNEAVRNIDDSPITDLSTLVELKLTDNTGADVPFTANIDGTNTIITIDPTSDLTSKTVYYLEINPVEDVTDHATTATNITFTTVDVVPPVLTFSPVNGATGINEVDNITISFDEPIRRASDDADLDDTNIDDRITLKLTDASGANIPFDATINAGNDVVTINPTSILPSNAIIYVAIADVEDASNNLINPDPTFITFTTGDTQVPTFTFSPLNAATNVSLTNNLTITFNEAIRKLDDSPITGTDLDALVELKLTNNAGAAVPFAATIDGTNKIITIDPASDLASKTVYYLEINPVEDAAGNTTTVANITFTTVDVEPPVITFNPVNGATGFNENNNIVLTLSEPIRRASDDADLTSTNIDALITLKLTDASGANIPFDATINGTDDVVTINPSSILPSTTVIYMAIAGVEDASNNLISPDPTAITFTTGDTQVPTMTFSPLNAATNVSAVGNITITLSEAVRKLDDTPISSTDLATLVELKETNNAGTPVGFAATIDVANKVITIDPTASLKGNQVYYVELNIVEDLFNNATTAQSITFTTELGPSITNFTPTSTCIGETVTITGLRFGVAEPSVTVNGVAATVTDHNNTSIEFTVPTTTTGSIVVTNNVNTLQVTSGGNLTVKPAVDINMVTSASNSGPAVSENFFIRVGGVSQTTVSYRVRRISPTTDLFTSPQTGDGGQLSFGPFSHGSPDIYVYAVEASSTNCTTVTLAQTVTVAIASIAADAGPATAQVCAGSSIMLGGSPTATGGTGFHGYAWSSSPAGFNSTAPNPTVSPTVNTTYTVTVSDNSGATAVDNIIVTVNAQPTLNFIPSGTDLSVRDQFNDQEDPYELAASASPADGTGEFSGTGVSRHADGKYYFDPADAGTLNNPITLTYKHTNTNGCARTITRQVNVFAANVIVNGLQNTYCTQGGASGTLSHNPAVIPAGLTFTRLRLFRGGYLDQLLDPTTYNNMFQDLGTAPKTYVMHPALVGIGFLYVTIWGTDGVTERLITYGTTTIYANPAAPTFLPLPSYCVSDVIANNIVSVNETGTINWYNASTPAGPITVADPRKATFSELGISETGSGTTTKYMTQTVNGCASLVTSVPVTVYANPSPPAISAPAPICSGDAFPNLAATGAGTLYRWYGTLGPGTPDPNTIYTPSTNIANPAQLLVPSTVTSTTSFQRYVSQFVNGCESPVASVDIAVKQTPIAPLAPSPTYCLNSTIAPIAVTTSGAATVRWYNDDLLTSEITGLADPENATATELSFSSTVSGDFFRYATQTLDGCESVPKTVELTINDLPAVTIRSSQDLSTICKSGSPVQLEVSQPNGTWSGDATPGFTSVDLAGGKAALSPSGAVYVPGQSYTLTYTYTDGSSSCQNFDTKTLTILPSITPSVTPGDACNGLFVNFTNNSSIVPPSATATIDNISWSFDDGDGLEIINGDPANIDKVIPAGTHGGNTTGTYRNPSHIFRSLSDFTVRYRMITSDGCAVEDDFDVQVNPIPDITFAWQGVCEGSGTQFNATVNNISDNNISTFAWDFARNSNLQVGTAGTGKNPVTTYSSVGTDIVELTVTSNANCSNTTSKPVYIVPTLTPFTETFSYAQNFNTATGGWIAGGKNSSWAFGKPAKIVINRDSSATGTGNAWVTNLTGNNNANEQSWVLSPCFDFSQAKKPVISMDIWSDTPRGLDGAVLQYNETGNIENDASWTVVGSVGSGINWYDQTGIVSKPGGQTSVDAGWTGDASNGRYKAWKHAVFKLDNLVGKSNVKLRIAFASNVGSQEGFAFDNIFIGERSRTVLVENFTNSSTASSALHNTFFNNFEDNNAEVVKVQYHTSFPGQDAVYALNASMNDARTAFYGITETATVRIDGQYRTGTAASWVSNLYDNRILEPSSLILDTVSIVKDGDIVKIRTKVTNITNAPLSLQNAHLFVVILEKTITGNNWLGNTGNTMFKFVAKDILPSPAGYKIGTEIAPGQTLMLPEVIWQKRNLITDNNSVIAVFIQSANTRDVYQARLFNKSAEPEIVTGIETSPDLAFGAYPNPADKEMTLSLSEPARQPAAIYIYDQMGKVVTHDSFEKGESRKTIPTTELSGGVYLIQVETPKGMLRRKVMVVHGN